MRIIVSAFVFVFIFFNLSGCSTFCTTSCDYRTKLPKNQAALESERVQILEGTIASSQKGEVTTQIEGDGGQAQALDAGLTVGIILGQINVLLDDLATSARDLTQEMRAIVGDVEGSTSQLISEIDDTLGNRLDDTLDQLNESERRLMTDAQSTIFALERSIQAIREGSDESIKTSLWEASIVAWDAEHSLPCIERVPRLVYATPSSFRIWPDYSKPGDPSYSDPEDRRKLIVKGLENLNGIKCSMPGGSFFVFPNVEETGMNGEEFTNKCLHEIGVAMIPGTAFGKFATHNVRLNFATSRENISKAIEKIDKILK